MMVVFIHTIPNNTHQCSHAKLSGHVDPPINEFLRLDHVFHLNMVTILCQCSNNQAICCTTSALIAFFKMVP